LRRSRFKQKQAGVTLIEMLIAISLVAILVAGLLTAMRTGLITYEKTGARLEANRRTMTVQQMISSQLENAWAVAGACPSSDPEKPAAMLPFFDGTQSWLRLVTAYSLAEGSRGAPRIVEYQAQPVTGGGFRLVVAEHLYNGPSSTAAYCHDLQPRPVQLGSGAMVLADHLSVCRFAYHPAYDPYTFKETPWLDVWDTRVPSLPAAVRLEMKSASPVASRLPVVSFTIPIRAERNPLAQYADSY